MSDQDELQNVTDLTHDHPRVLRKNTTVISPDPFHPVTLEAAKPPVISPDLDKALDEFVADKPPSIMQEPKSYVPDPILDAMVMRHQQHLAGRQASNPNALRGPQAGPEAPGPRPVPRTS
jgi:hypothetical protein